MIKSSRYKTFSLGEKLQNENILTVVEDNKNCMHYLNDLIRLQWAK